MTTEQELIKGIEEKTDIFLLAVLEEKSRNNRKGVPETYGSILCPNTFCLSNTYRAFEDEITGHLIMKCAECGHEQDTKRRHCDWDVL